MSTTHANANQDSPVRTVPAKKLVSSFPEQKSPEAAEPLPATTTESSQHIVKRSEDIMRQLLSEDADTNDEDYKPEEDQHEEDADAAAEEEDMSHLVDANEEKTLPSDDKQDESFQKEFSEALDGVRLLAASQRGQLLESAKARHEAETGEVVEDDVLSQAFNLLKIRLYPDGTMDEEVPDSEEDEYDSEEKASEEDVPDVDEESDAEMEAEVSEEEFVEEEIQISEDALRAEIDDAFKAVRSRGRYDGRMLAELVSDTYYEMTGKEATIDDATEVFSRIQAQFVEEAEEELIYDDDEAIAEPVDAPTIDEHSKDVIAYLPTNDTEDTKRKALLEYARSVISPEVTEKAKAKFISIADRTPTFEEIDDLVITLATSTIADADLESSDASDSDYNPDDIVELELESTDYQIDLEEAGEVDYEDAYDVLEDEQEDSDYDPAQDEDQEDIDIASADQELALCVDEEQKVDSAVDDADSDMDSDVYRSELSAAIVGVRKLASFHREQMLEKARVSFEDETGEYVDDRTLAEAFDWLKEKLSSDTMSDSETEEYDSSEDDDSDAVESGDEATNEAVDMEDMPVMTEAEMRAELEEAFEVVRECGRADGAIFAEMVSETYYEMNGEHPDVTDLADVFARIKEEFAEEAMEEIVFDDDVTINEPMEDDIESDSAEEDERKELVAYARSVVMNELADKAKAEFVAVVEREPTTDEMDDLLITLATTRFVDADFEDSDAADSDYNPMDSIEQLIEEGDIELDDEETVDKADAFAVLGAYDEAYPIRKESIAFYSPLRHSDKQINTTVLNEELMAKAVARFQKTHKRGPNKAEKAQLAKFLTTDDLEWELSDSESDSDYDPSKDDTCDANADDEMNVEFELTFEPETTVNTVEV